MFDRFKEMMTSVELTGTSKRGKYKEYTECVNEVIQWIKENNNKYDAMKVKAKWAGNRNEAEAVFFDITEKWFKSPIHAESFRLSPSDFFVNNFAKELSQYA
jgi:hypothetical protein